MSIEKLDAPVLLGLNKFNVDEQEPHIAIDKNVCSKCQTKGCLVVCPAVLYRMDVNGDIIFDHAGCLECGTCRVVCHDIGNKGIVKWQYPRGTFGVSYRHG